MPGMQEPEDGENDVPLWDENRGGFPFFRRRIQLHFLLPLLLQKLQPCLIRPALRGRVNITSYYEEGCVYNYFQYLLAIKPRVCYNPYHWNKSLNV